MNEICKIKSNVAVFSKLFSVLYLYKNILFMLTDNGFNIVILILINKYFTFFSILNLNLTVTKSSCIPKNFKSIKGASEQSQSLRITGVVSRCTLFTTSSRLLAPFCLMGCEQEKWLFPYLICSVNIFLLFLPLSFVSSGHSLTDSVWLVS